MKKQIKKQKTQLKTTNEMADKNKTFLEVHRERIEILGFWDDTYKSTVIMQIEDMYKTEIIKEWGISDIVINGDKVLLKWFKRHQPLSAEELKKMYGR